jgi:hypothetical protein
MRGEFFELAGASEAFLISSELSSNGKLETIRFSKISMNILFG